MKSGASGGASFSVELPVGTASLKPAARGPDRSPPAGAGGSVLVVEDEAALGAAVSEALVDAGFSVTLASDGIEALDRLKERPYDLIVCDLKMPRLDGASFYRRLEAEHAALARRVLFVTGDVAGTEAERFLEETGCRWLPKPFRLKDLLRVAGRDARLIWPSRRSAERVRRRQDSRARRRPVARTYGSARAASA